MRVSNLMFLAGAALALVACGPDDGDDQTPPPSEIQEPDQGVVEPEIPETADDHAVAATGPVIVAGAWVRANPIADRPAAAYFTMLSTAADVLIGADTPAAGRAELHAHEHHDGVMKMVHVDSVPLRCGAIVAFKPGGYHVMLFDLTHPLVAGEAVPLTLTFEKAGAVEVTAIVGEGPASPVDTGALEASVSCQDSSTMPAMDQMGDMDHMDHMQ